MVDNKPTALVTGASRGIGRAIALQLAKDGYHVIINSRTADPNNLIKGAYEVKNTIEQAGGSAVIKRADLSSTQERNDLVSFIDREIGGIDLLINNAGIEPETLDLLNSTEERFDHVFNTNLKGPYFLTQQIANRMIKTQSAGITSSPKIVFITSIQAYMISTRETEYAMTKASLHMAMLAFAIRLGEQGINVYEISPGVIRTDMALIHEENIDKMIRDGKLVTRRWGMPEEIASVVSVIAKGNLDYSTGTTIEVGGGIGIRRL
jgi:NAD(P)-dependent dehydrogenase (short-subunit alcohol dehydrogenase family)